MPRFLGPAVLSVFSLFALQVGAQTASTTTVLAFPNSTTAGSPVSADGVVGGSPAPFVNPAGAVVLPTGTLQFYDGTAALGNPAVLTPGSGFLTTPFSKVFGAIDPAFTLIAGTLVGDLNGDGVEDLLIQGIASSAAEPQSNEEVQTFVSNSKGGYTATAATSLTIPPAQATSSPALVDVNGDGKLDLLIGPSVAYGNGDGTFSQPVQPAFLANGFSYTYAADVTGDGRTDIIALNKVPSVGLGNQPYTLQVTVFANQGGGNFQSLGTFPIGTGQVVEFASLNSLSFVDLNGDGRLDMVAQMYFVPAGNAAEPATITALLNNGDGTFGAPVSVTYTPQQNGGLIQLQALEAADFNKDGRVDLALIYQANPSSQGSFVNPIVFLPGDGNGSFGPEIDSLVSTNTVLEGEAPGGDSVVTDTNLDGALDIAFGSGAIVLGDGTGHFTSGVGAGGAGAAEGSQSAIAAITFPGNPYPSVAYIGQPGGAAPFPLVASPNVTSSAILPPAALSVGMHAISAKYGGDAHYAASSSAPVTVTVAPAMVLLSATASANPSYAGQQVTYSIAVAGSGPAPTGTVSLTGTGTAASPATLDGTGKATIAVAFANAGSAPVTVSYSGDANYAAATISVPQTVTADFAVTPPSTGAAIAVASGQSGTSQISIAGAAGYTGTVTLSCTGLPAAASCSFSPASLNLAGTTAQSATLTVSTGGSSTARMALPEVGGGLKTLACGIFAGSLLLMWPGRRKRTFCRAMWSSGMLAVALAALILVPTGCGGSSSSKPAGSSTPAGTYPFSVVATSGTTVLTTSYTLTVQ